MRKKLRKTKKVVNNHPVEYKSYFVPAGGRDPALVEASIYYATLKSKGLITPKWVKDRGGPSPNTVRRYTRDDIKKFTKRPNATTFFAFLATLPGIKGYDVRKQRLIVGE